MQKEPRFLTITEAAKFLGVSPDTLRRWEDKGIVTPHRTKGGNRRYTLLDLKIAKLNKKKARFLSLSYLRNLSNLGTRRDLKVALLTSLLWILVIISWHFLGPVLTKPTNFTESIPPIPTLIKRE